MKRKILYWCLLLCAMSILAAFPMPQDVRYGTGSWDAETLGNHRAGLRVSRGSEFVSVRIPWRRLDTEPDKENIIIAESTGKKITNIYRMRIDRSEGLMVFQAQNAGTYYYYPP